MHVYCVCIYRPLDIRDMTAANALLLTLYKNAWKGGREVTGIEAYIMMFPLNWAKNKIE
jgi:hypothetical protein